jgi:hypothetical protein
LGYYLVFTLYDAGEIYRNGAVGNIYAEFAAASYFEHRFGRAAESFRRDTTAIEACATQFAGFNQEGFQSLLNGDGGGGIPRRACAYND